jgi:hypothetical protein
MERVDRRPGEELSTGSRSTSEMAAAREPQHGSRIDPRHNGRTQRISARGARGGEGLGRGELGQMVVKQRGAHAGAGEAGGDAYPPRVADGRPAGEVLLSLSTLLVAACPLISPG